MTFPVTASLLPSSDPEAASGSGLPALLFAVAHTVLAVPLHSVIRVIRTPASIRHQTQEIGLMSWAGQEITLLNLYPRMAPQYAHQLHSLAPFLILVRSQQGEGYGLAVQNSPNLFALPLSTIRPLPDSYRRSLPLDLASHVAVLPRPDSPLIVFLLDLNRITRSLLA